MRFTVTIDCDNAAFEDDLSCEVANILRKVVRSVEKDGSQEGALADSNGNICGEYHFTRTPEEQAEYLRIHQMEDE
jgi:hypothetical protein